MSHQLQYVRSTAAICVLVLVCAIGVDADEHPNVLMIAVDDLNHWVGHFGRNPQTRTPNIDRLARRGVSFTNAHCVAPACEPSRCALMSGRRPWSSGCFKNGHEWKSYQTPGEGLTAQFLDAGYHVAGAGKIYHAMAYHAEEWTEYMSRDGLSSNGPGVKKMDGYHVERLHPQLRDEDLIDWHTTNFCIEQLQRDHVKPFFVACGLYKPHLPFVVPRKYYEPFPLESIQRPPVRANDLDDLPTAGVRMANPMGDHRRFLESGRWEAAIQSYLATVSYTDMNVGRLLDALDNSPYRDNTIVVLWGDHGWSFGEKQHWRKFALWEEATRTPCIWVVPGTTPQGQICQQAVDHQSIYPTLCALAGISKPRHVEGEDIRPLLREPQAAWDRPAITTHGRGNHAVRSQTHRLIRYADGSEELYDLSKDPYEWDNLAPRLDSNDDLKGIRDSLAKWFPKKEARARARAGARGK